MAQLKLKHAPTTNAFNTTLNGSISDSATTIPLNSTTSLQNKAGILVVDRQDADGNATPSKREYIYFTSVSGSSVVLPDTADGRGQSGSTAQSHADGSIVESIMDVDQYNGLVDSYDIQHNDDGTHDAVTSNTLVLSSTLNVGGAASLVGPNTLGNVNLPSTASGYYQTGIPLVGLNISGELEVGDSKQLLGYAEVTANQTTISTETDLTGLSVTVTTPELLGRRIKITGWVSFSSAGTSAMWIALRLREDDTQISDGNVVMDVSGRNILCTTIAYQTPSAGSHTYKLRAARIGGTDLITMVAGATEPAFISVEVI